MRNHAKVEKIEVIDEHKKLDADEKTVLWDCTYKCQLKYSKGILFGTASLTTGEAKPNDVYEITFYSDLKKVDGDWYAVNAEYDYTHLTLIDSTR